MDEETNAIKQLLTHVSNKDYSKAETYLQKAVEEKIKSRVRKEISDSAQEN